MSFPRSPLNRNENQIGEMENYKSRGERRVTYILHLVPFKVFLWGLGGFGHENVLLIPINKFKINVVSGIALPRRSCFIPFEDRKISSWPLALYFLPPSSHSAQRSSLPIPLLPCPHGGKGPQGPLIGSTRRVSCDTVFS